MRSDSSLRYLFFDISLWIIFQVWRRRKFPPCAFLYGLFQIEGVQDVMGIEPSSFVPPVAELWRDGSDFVKTSSSAKASPYAKATAGQDGG